MASKDATRRFSVVDVPSSLCPLDYPRRKQLRSAYISTPFLCASVWEHRPPERCIDLLDRCHKSWEPSSLHLTRDRNCSTVERVRIPDHLSFVPFFPSFVHSTAAHTSDTNGRHPPVLTSHAKHWHTPYRPCNEVERSCASLSPHPFHDDFDDQTHVFPSIVCIRCISCCRPKKQTPRSMRRITRAGTQNTNREIRFYGSKSCPGLFLTVAIACAVCKSTCVLFNYSFWLLS